MTAARGATQGGDGADGSYAGGTAANSPSGGLHAPSPVPLDHVAPLGATIADRAVDAVLFSARDAYMLAGIALLVVQPDGGLRSYHTGHLGFAGVSPAVPVGKRTAFAVDAARAGRTLPEGPAKDAPAASRGQFKSPPHSPQPQRAFGHTVDLAAGRVTAMTTRPAGSAERWLQLDDFVPALGVALQGCGHRRTGSALPTAWRQGGDLAARQRCSVQLGAAGFFVHLEVAGERHYAFALLTNAQGAQATGALLGQVRRVLCEYIPEPR